ncbi:hypothetical protein PTI98_008865 [Pleurotus ostreatus]|nr:hypothetical protein PTI98_008865 [Pleurotus ostreatus]
MLGWNGLCGERNPFRRNWTSSHGRPRYRPTRQHQPTQLAKTEVLCSEGSLFRRNHALLKQMAKCCMSGCAVCVYDLYEDSLSAYKESLATLRSSLEERGIPETEWPSSLRGAGTPVPPKNNVALSAFEEFERALKAKKQTSDGQVVPR